MATPKKVLTNVKDFNIVDNRVITIELEPQKRVPRFKAGQFLHLTLDEYDYSSGWPESRIFLIASPPADRKKNIKLIISKQGRYTKRIFEEININKSVWIKLPYGDFTIKNRINNKAVFIAGGTGISPFLSILNDENSKQIPIKLYYGIRSDKYFFSKESLLKKEKDDDSFEMEVFNEDNGNNQYNKGKLDISYIYKSHKNENCNYFISGPKEMIDNFKEYLLQNNVNEERIIIDEWE